MAVLRALAAGSLAVGEFSVILIDHVPAWDKQDELGRRLMALLDDWELQTTLEGFIIRAGLEAVSQYEDEHGLFTPGEIAAADEWAARITQPAAARRTA